MNPNSLGSENFAVLATLNPVSQAAATVVSAYVDARKFAMITAVLATGVLGASATIDAKLRQATDSSGTGVKDITGKAITQLTEAGTDSDKQAIVEVTAEEVFAQGFRYIRGALVIGTATSDAGMIAIASEPRYFPASDYDASSVDEIVA